MVRAGFLALALTLTAHTVYGQQAAVVFRGRVLDAENDRPLRRALVTVPGSGRARAVLTDDEGRFEIEGTDTLTALTVKKAGYVSTQVTASPRATDVSQAISVRLSRGGVISGRVLDSNGESGVGATVTARLENAGSDGITTFEAEVDDLGEYRLIGLPAGRFAVAVANTGTRVVMPAEFERIEAEIKQGTRRMYEVVLAATEPPRFAQVQSGEATESIDFEIPATGTLRALSPVMNQVMASAASPPVTSWRPGAPPAVIIGPPQPELRGGRILSVFTAAGTRNLNLALFGGGAVSGTVVDGAGEPFQGITVRALQVRHEHGQHVARAFGSIASTDDRGRYRVHSLAPGSYLIVLSLDGVEYSAGVSSSLGFASLYYPGTSDVGAAQLLRVEANVDLSGTDLTFAASPVVRLAGRAFESSGQPLVGRVWLAVSQRASNVTTDPRIIRISGDGSFEFADVAPGEYVVQALRDAGFGGPAEFGFEHVTVSEREPPAVRITTSPGATLEGRFVADGSGALPMRAYSLEAASLDLDRSPVNGGGKFPLAVYDDGRFYMRGLRGPMRLSAPSTLPGWYVKSVTIGGVDVTDAPYDFGSVETTVTDAEVVLSTAGATIAGSIERRVSARGSLFTVLVYSTRREHWFDGSRHVKRTTSAENGSFEVTGLPPGEYYVAAIEASTSLDLQAPETLESQMVRATRVVATGNVVSTVTLIR